MVDYEYDFDYNKTIVCNSYVLELKSARTEGDVLDIVYSKSKFKSLFNIDYTKPISINNIKTPTIKSNKEYLFNKVNEDTYKYISKYLKKKKGLYCIEFDNGSKLGITNDLNNRLVSYKSPWCHKIKNIYFIETSLPEKKLVEKYLIKYYKKNIVENSKEFISKDVEFKDIIKHLHYVTFKKMVIPSMFKELI